MLSFHSYVLWVQQVSPFCLGCTGLTALSVFVSQRYFIILFVISLYKDCSKMCNETKKKTGNLNYSVMSVFNFSTFVLGVGLEIATGNG